MAFFQKIFNHYDRISRIILLIFSVVILVLVFPKEGKFKYEFQKGKPWMHENLIAPFNFAILKSDEEVQNEEQKIIDNLKPYFAFNDEITRQQKDLLAELFSENWEAKYGKDDMFLQQRLENKIIADKIFDQVFNTGIIEIHQVIEQKANDFIIMLLRENVATESELSSVFSLRSASDTLAGLIDKENHADKDLLESILVRVLRHNLLYDESKTENEKESLLANVSLSQGMVQEGELVISQGELVTPEKFMILSSLKKNYETQLSSVESYYSILGGQIILISISLLVLIFFLLFFRKEITKSTKSMVMIFSIIIIAVLLISIVLRYNVNYLYLVPVCIVPIVMRTLFDARLALYIHLITIIIIGFLVPNSFEFVFVQLIAGIIALLSMVHLESRSQFFLTSIWLFLSYSAVYVGLTLIQGEGIEGLVWNDFIFLAIASLLTLFAYPLIFIYEKIFGIITDVTLIELSNTNNKLLRELASVAPGTFQHSLQVANLSEAAIRDVGGNVLLVRAGALYHDIGKMEMPMYFIENQTTGLNPHDELTYEESARIIVSHVIKGVEIAKKHKLPEEIIDFIRTHHGTRRVEYFYIMKQKDEPEEEIDLELFSYPGPIPFSKETAVLMMADSVEAASRSIKKPDEEKINMLVENIINKQIETKQFVNSDITLRDINHVKKIFKAKLINILHVRIAYPE